MNAIIRHDHHPKRSEARVRGAERVIGRHPADGFADEPVGRSPRHSGHARSRVMPHVAHVDLFRLAAACFGLAVYLGPPAAAVAYLAVVLVG